MSIINLLNQAKLIHGVSPANYSATTSPATYVSLKNYQRCYIWIKTGAIADGTGVASLLQASAVAGTGAKALAFDHYYSDTGTENRLAKSTGTSITLGFANNQWIIPIDPAQLDGNPTGSDAAFDCLSVSITAPGGNDFYSVDYILVGPRHAEDVPLTAVLD